jgi:hypothetical protein
MSSQAKLPGAVAAKRGTSGELRSVDFQVGLARTMRTNRTVLAQRQPKAGLETGAPAERRQVAGFAQTNEQSSAK